MLYCLWIENTISKNIWTIRISRDYLIIIFDITNGDEDIKRTTRNYKYLRVLRK